MKTESCEKRLFEAMIDLKKGAVLYLADFEKKQEEFLTAFEKVERKLKRLEESRDMWKVRCMGLLK